ncbi:hypothetical protein OIU76_020460 [Salix suchowensis]|nr:hypothetical protein OIU76_020460 [Salix suchowensis]
MRSGSLNHRWRAVWWECGHVLRLHLCVVPSSWTAYTDKHCYLRNVRRVADSDFLAGTGIVRTAAYDKMLWKQQCHGFFRRGGSRLPATTEDIFSISRQVR